MESSVTSSQTDEQSQPKEKWYNPLTQTQASHVSGHARVTPLSKALAMALFIVLPFVGFWLGVGYGVQRDAWKAVSVASTTTQSLKHGGAHFQREKTFWTKELSVGTEGGDWDVSEGVPGVSSIMLEIPVGALEQQVSLSIGFSQGEMSLVSGDGVV